MVNSEAEFFISDKKIKLEDEDGNYIFWVAFLNSENEENERSIRTMYGYTELLPGQITADTLISSDGNSYMDFLLNKFKIGNKKSSLDWNVSKDEQLSINILSDRIQALTEPSRCFWVWFSFEINCIHTKWF